MSYTNLLGQVRVGVRPAVTAQQLQTATYLLNSYGGAAAAYSLRKLNSTYGGSAIRVRRSVDNVEGNIGFDASGNLDTASLSSFTNPTDTGKLLDSYSGASVAYSLRKLSATYSGSAIRVRRSSDNQEMNIGFDASGNLDTTGLLSFVGSGSGFVTTWYDQSGNGNNAFQSSSSNQPQIVNNGSLILRNSKPYIEATSSRYFQFTTELYNESGGEYSLWMTYEKDSGGNNAILLKDGGNYHWLDYGTQQNISNWGIINISTAHAINTLYLINTIAGNSGSTQYRNSLSLNSSGAPGVARSTNLPASSYRTAKITMSEFIYYPTNKTSQRAGISSNINGYYSIHSPNGSAFVTTWYDQSGNGRNATQTSASSQPMILSSGSINLVGGKPSIYFNGANFISSPYNLGSTNEMYFLTQTTDTMYLYPSNNTLVNYGFVAQSGNTGGPNSGYGSPQLYTNGFLRSVSNRTDVYNSLNGYKLSVHKGANLTGWSANPTMFGNYYGGGYEYTGDLQEWLIYPTLQGSQSQIESNINSHYSLWDSSIVQSGLVMNLDASFKSSYLGSGTTWYDISGYGNNNGTMMNGVGYTASNGGGLTFNGTNQYVDFGQNKFKVDNFTMEIVFKIDQLPTVGGVCNSPQYGIIGQQDWGYTLRMWGDGKAAFRVSDASGADITVRTQNSVVGSRCHITVKKNGTSISIYLNGVLQNTATLASSTVRWYYTTWPFQIGNAQCGMGNYYINGTINLARFYTTVLTDAEILQNFNATKSRFGL